MEVGRAFLAIRSSTNTIKNQIRHLSSLNSIRTSVIQSISMLNRAQKAYKAAGPRPDPINHQRGAGPVSKANCNVMEAFNVKNYMSNSPDGISRSPHVSSRPQLNSYLMCESNSSTPPLAAPVLLHRASPSTTMPPRAFMAVESTASDLSQNSVSNMYGRKSNSFEDPGLTEFAQWNQPPQQLPEGIYIADDDFSSDDGNMDFENDPIEASLVAPSCPRDGVAEATYEPTLNPQDSLAKFRRSATRASHWRPKCEQLLKREAPDDETVNIPLPKKRALPIHWNMNQDTPPNAPSMPAEKSEKIAQWNQATSAVKDQKRNHKIQMQKKENAAETTFAATSSSITKQLAHGTVAFSLSAEQQYVLDLVVNKGQSVFFTGPAGTGKSVLMRAIIHKLKKKWARDPERLGITASTGLAACNIGGMTLHSFSGIGLGKEDAPTLVKKIRRNTKAKQRWLRTRALIIDEVSMVDGELFDKLSHVGRAIRNNGRPWGGIQLIITGDFFQLPPVPEGHDKKREVKFSFEADTWTTSIDHTIGLTEVFRQKDPGRYVHALLRLIYHRLTLIY